jgi:hypothetical protein
MFWRSRAPGEGNCLAKFSLQTLAKKNRTIINESIGYKYQNMCWAKPLKNDSKIKVANNLQIPDFRKALCLAEFDKIHF